MVTATVPDTRPLYTLSQAAEIVGVPRRTLHDWARGYRYKGADGQQTGFDALITTGPERRGPVVPFVGLAEAYVLNAFRRAGVSMQRIRPALARLEEEFGVGAALASNQLRTDGAEVLWKFGEETHEPELQGRLVQVRDHQLVFDEVVEKYLKTITYNDEGTASLIRLPSFTPAVVVDPQRAFGQPILASRGVRIADIRDRLAAGEPAEDVAADYRVDLADVLSLAA